MVEKTLTPQPLVKPDGVYLVACNAPGFTAPHQHGYAWVDSVINVPVDGMSLHRIQHTGMLITWWEWAEGAQVQWPGGNSAPPVAVVQAAKSEDKPKPVRRRKKKSED